MTESRSPDLSWPAAPAECPILPRQAAGELLLRQRLCTLFVDVTKLRYDRRVVFTSYDDFCRQTKMTMAELERLDGLRDGCTLIMERGGAITYVILFNQRQAGLRRRNFTLAHEIGHIYLEHRDDSGSREAEANLFASELLMPLALLSELQRRAGRRLTPEDICPVFQVSKQAASVGIGRLRTERPSSETDRMLLRRFGGLLPAPDGPVVDV